MPYDKISPDALKFVISECQRGASEWKLVALNKAQKKINNLESNKAIMQVNSKLVHDT